MPKFEGHDCLLRDQAEDVVKHFIDTGFFINIRRKFRSWCMISRSHPETARFFKSYSACRDEEVRHLVHHYYMIHPFSKLNLYWDFFVFCLYSTFYLIIPMDIWIFFIRNRKGLGSMKYILDMMQLADAAKLFFTGYYDPGKSKVILKFSKIVRRYLLTYFFFDIFSCINFFLQSLKIFVDISYRVTFLMRVLSRLRIVRLPRCLKIMELFRRYMGYSNYLFKGIRVIYILIVMMLWAFSVNFYMTNYILIYIKNDMELAEASDIYHTFYEATSMALLVSFQKYEISDIMEYVNAFFFLTLGFILQMFLYVQLFQVWIKYQNAENKHRTLQQQFEEYVKYYKLPVSLRETVFSYFQFKFHKNFFKESDIEMTISPFTRQEILIHSTIRHIEKVEFFRHFSQNIMLKVIAQLKTEIFLPGEVIISAGKRGSSMFFIYHGTVAVYTPGGKEICHLEDGTHFGEIALILSETRVATVVAITPCELFTLRRSDFLAAIESFPERKEQLIALATERMQSAIAQ